MRNHLGSFICVYALKNRLYKSHFSLVTDESNLAVIQILILIFSEVNANLFKLFYWCFFNILNFSSIQSIFMYKPFVQELGILCTREITDICIFSHKHV